MYSLYDVFSINYPLGAGYHLRDPSLCAHLSPSQVELRRSIGETLGVSETGKGPSIFSNRLIPCQLKPYRFYTLYNWL